MEGLTGTELEAVVDERLICRRAYAAEYFVAAVSGIVEERVADRLHVYAYLVGASCFEYTLYHRHIRKGPRCWRPWKIL